MASEAPSEVERLRNAIRIILENVGMSTFSRRQVWVLLGDVPPEPETPPVPVDPRDAELAALRAQLAAATAPAAPPPPAAPIETPPQTEASADAGNSADALPSDPPINPQIIPSEPTE